MGADKEYCKKISIKLSIPREKVGEEFLAAREQSFVDAVRVWNEVDKSTRKRIVLPKRRVDVQMVPVTTSTAISYTDSDREGDEQDDDE